MSARTVRLHNSRPRYNPVLVSGSGLSYQIGSHQRHILDLLLTQQHSRAQQFKLRNNLDLDDVNIIAFLHCSWPHSLLLSYTTNVLKSSGMFSVGECILKFELAVSPALTTYLAIHFTEVFQIRTASMAFSPQHFRIMVCSTICQLSSWSSSTSFITSVLNGDLVTGESEANLPLKTLR